MSDFGTRLDDQTVQFSRLVHGPIERVWSYLTDAELRGKWFAHGPMEPRVGGKADLVFANGTIGPEPRTPPERYRKHLGPFDSAHVVTIWEPPHRLGFTWDDDLDPQGSEVVIELAQEGDKVRLVLTHKRLKNTGAVIDVSGGWHTHLLMLAELLEGHPHTSFWAALDVANAEYRKRFGG
jgi:uncharacterized protein YndB with AHSA1/START domain